MYGINECRLFHRALVIGQEGYADPATVYARFKRAHGGPDWRAELNFQTLNFIDRLNDAQAVGFHWSAEDIRQHTEVLTAALLVRNDNAQFIITDEQEMAYLTMSNDIVDAVTEDLG